MSESSTDRFGQVLPEDVETQAARIVDAAEEKLDAEVVENADRMARLAVWLSDELTDEDHEAVADFLVTGEPRDERIRRLTDQAGMLALLSMSSMVNAQT